MQKKKYRDVAILFTLMFFLMIGETLRYIAFSFLSCQVSSDAVAGGEGRKGGGGRRNRNEYFHIPLHVLILSEGWCQICLS